MTAETEGRVLALIIAQIGVPALATRHVAGINYYLWMQGHNDGKSHAKPKSVAKLYDEQHLNSELQAHHFCRSPKSSDFLKTKTKLVGFKDAAN